jgi:hypothetical protein
MHNAHSHEHQLIHETNGMKLMYMSQLLREVHGNKTQSEYSIPLFDNVLPLIVRRLQAVNVLQWSFLQCHTA